MNVDLGNVNYLAVIVSAVVAFGLGAAWYGVLAKPWMAASGITQEDIDAHKSEAMRGYAIAAVTWVIAALAVASLVQLTDAEGFLDGLLLGLLVGVGVVATSMAPHFAFEFKSLKLYLIDVGYPAAALAIVGVILGVWQ